MSISSRTALKTACMIFVVLALVGSNGCKKLGEGLTKLVFIEYDQPLNFTEYQFANYIHPADASEWRDIRLEDSVGKTRGVWMTYLLCSIKNEASKAEDFKYDVSKFYVDYDGRKQYYRPLAAYTYAGVSPVTGPGTPGATNGSGGVAEAFRTETQLGPDTETIPPNNNRSNYRLVIYVSTKIGDLTDLTTLRQRLYYDGTPVDMVDRNNDPVAAQGAVLRDNLPTTCRPPRK